LGRVGGDRYCVKVNGQVLVDEPVALLETIWRQTLSDLLSISV